MVHKFGTIYSQNGGISLSTDLKKLSKATLLQIIANPVTNLLYLT